MLAPQKYQLFMRSKRREFIEVLLTSSVAVVAGACIVAAARGDATQAVIISIIQYNIAALVLGVCVSLLA